MGFSVQPDDRPRIYRSNRFDLHVAKFIDIWITSTFFVGFTQNKNRPIGLFC